MNLPLTLGAGRCTVCGMSRYGGGLSLRGAMELVQNEKEQARLDKFDEKQVRRRPV